jgi:putative aminopeptidase FrvX
MELLRLLKEMTAIPALSGHEERMARYLRDALAPCADEVMVDSTGNVIARLQGREPGGPRVMVLAHMDQLGFVVRKVEPDGFICLERLGGIPERVLPGTKVLVESEDGATMPGVIGIKAHHATPADEKYVVIPYDRLYVDIGASCSDEVHALGIEVGCPVVYEPEFRTLTGGRVAGTSIDNRGGCAALVELAKLAHDSRPAATLFLVGSVQEEFNLRGAMIAAAAIQPDIAIALDVMVAGDTPDLKDRSDLKLGGGPVLGMYSFHGRGTLNGTIPHPMLARLVRETARREDLPLQRSAAVGCLTDSAYVQLTGTGVPSVDVGFPARYTHTPVETCQLSDLEQLVQLVFRVVGQISLDSQLSRV